MADNKLTKAQQAAEPKKRKRMTVEESPPKGRRGAKYALNAPAEEKKEQKDPRSVLRGDAAFPLRYAFAAFCGLLLLVFISVLFTDDGLILKLFVDLICGLFGRNVYYISIPALIYLIWLQLASRNQLVRGRSFSIVAFVLLFGCISHLIANPELTTGGLAQVGERYKTGLVGLSGGVICGTLTDILCLAFGQFFTASVMMILSALCLMVGAKLDLMGLFRKSWTIIVTRFAERRAAQQDVS